MRKTKRILFFLLCFLGTGRAWAVAPQHFITDTAYRHQVERDFRLKQRAIADKSLFNIFNTRLDDYETEALKFLYAYMPVGDIADMPGSYYLKQVRQARRVRQEMPWGKNIPEEIFRHFVLPLRVNNENLDSARLVFYRDLRDRVKGLSLHDAVLEVNHWCHEKMTYSPSDARTSAPLSSYRNSLGRCGEESTFAVTALRSVGIPARQVYTPRWAHTDDNHAWVEAWVDGRWHYLGACEPEAVLDHGWFDESASRGMLMHTKVFGPYTGSETVIARTPLYTEINLTSNYAAVGNVLIHVTDANGSPVQGATVQARIYNYAEFYPAARFQTDAKGQVTIQAGRGDLLIWACKDGKAGWTKVSFGTDKEKTIRLGEVQVPYTEDITIVPPASNVKPVAISQSMKEENDRRLAHEDSLRNAYVRTFFTKETATEWAQKHNFSDRVVPLLVGSRGHHDTLTLFLLSAQSEGKADEAISLLESLSHKDLRDVEAATLRDHFHHTPKTSYADSIYYQMVMSPRVSVEMIYPYKEYFQKAVPASLKKAFKQNPRQLLKWCDENLTLRPDLNYPNMIVSPEGVWRTRLADKFSRKVFVVAMLRSLGVAAMLDPVTSVMHWYSTDGTDHELRFSDEKVVEVPKGRLVMDYTPTADMPNPKYYSQFSLSKVVDGGTMLLNYSEGGAGEEPTSWSNTFKNGAVMDEGVYLLTSGMRRPDGSVPAHLAFFRVEKDKDTHVRLELSDNGEGTVKQSEATFDTSLKFDKVKGGTGDLRLPKGSYGVLALIGVNHEPSNHIQKDMALVGKELEKVLARTTLLFSDSRDAKKYNASDFPGLPTPLVYGIDKDGKIRMQLAEALKLSDATRLPIVVLYDADGNILLHTQGYTIGLGETLLKEVNKRNALEAGQTTQK